MIDKRKYVVGQVCRLRSAAICNISADSLVRIVDVFHARVRYPYSVRSIDKRVENYAAEKELEPVTDPTELALIELAE